MSGVYVITDGEYFKIGQAVDPVRRLADLQVGNARQLHLAFWIEVQPELVLGVERAAQARLAHLRMKGEWFACLTSCAVWAIMAVVYPGCVPEDEEPEPEESVAA